MGGRNSLLWLNNIMGTPGDRMPSIFPAAVATSQPGPPQSHDSAQGWATTTKRGPQKERVDKLAPTGSQGLFGNVVDDEPQGLLGGLQRGFTNPMTLAGLGLLSGGGWDAAGQGMRMGMGFDEQRRQDAARQQFQGLLQDPSVTSALPAPMLRVAQMAGPSGGPELLAKYLDPAREADLAYKKALTEKAMRETANGGEQPSNVREWQFFSRLSPEDQLRYNNMKRAERYYDTGTQFVAPNSVDPSAAPRTIDKNVAEKARQEELGKASGISEAALPTVLNASERMLATIDAIDSDPNLGRVTGLVGGRIPKGLHTEDMAETQSRLDQIQGQTFLQAYNDLRGAGQITEREGMAAQAAYNRLTTQTMGTEAYRKALKEFRSEVVKLVDIAKKRAGVSDGGNALQSRGAQPFVQDGWSIQRVD